MTGRAKIEADHRTIFDLSRSGRGALAQNPLREDNDDASYDDIPEALLRAEPPALPEVSELQVVRHYTNLSRRNFSIDNQFYPLGSCTMKYNPRGAHKAALLPGFAGAHPLAPDASVQGLLEALYALQTILADITGMRAVSLAPMAGAQGELAGVTMIRAYHDARGDDERQVILVPSAAHGTNPATAVMCGYRVQETPVDADGDVDVAALKESLGPHVAGLMMTNPSTCGVYEREILEISAAVHAAGGLLYYDGANLNAILGKVKPGDMGFDVLHLNLHKTFATPHGGGGPGAGPVGVSERLEPFLPTPIVGRDAHGYRWLTQADVPESIGRLSAFAGNTGILLRAYAYALMLGREGVYRVGEMATLNANYLARRLAAEGFELAYPDRRATHEFILTFARLAKSAGVTAMDVAKRLLDFGVHAPTTYFPLLIPECFLIEPTETESKEELDAFVDAMCAIRREAESDADFVKGAPYQLPVRRLDDVKAARELDLAQPLARPLS